MMRSQISASYVHSADGLGGVMLPESDRKPESIPAWDTLYQAAVKYAGELVLIAVGDDEHRIDAHEAKDFPGLIKRIVIMAAQPSSAT